jgi:hypothetical protein
MVRLQHVFKPQLGFMAQRVWIGLDFVVLGGHNESHVCYKANFTL